MNETQKAIPGSIPSSETLENDVGSFYIQL